MKALREFVDEASKLPAADQAGYISDRLPEILSEGPIRMWRPGDATPRLGWRTLVGVATYSVLDLRLLDALINAATHTARPNEILQVFDVAECRDAQDFEQYVPGIGPVYQTPVVGMWENGVLSQKASGARARKLLVEHYNLGLPV